MNGYHSYHRQLNWTPFKNTTGSEIPAYAVMKLTAYGEVFGDSYLEMGANTTYGSQWSHFVNDGIPVPANGYGLCCLPAGTPVAALYDSSDGSIAVGDRVGPRSGAYKLRKNTGGFRVVGTTMRTIDASSSTILVIQQPMLHFVGKTDSTHAKSATGTISIYSGTTLGSESDTTVNMTGVYNRFAAIGSGKWVKCAWNEYGDNWELVAAEC